jgi:hypothetical protein
MFDTGRVEPDPASPASVVAGDPRLALLGQQARPTTLAAERHLPVLPALAPLLPEGRLTRGTTVGVAGIGATSLALAVVAAASAEGSWTVAVGLGDLGLIAAAEAGIDLGRLVLVAPPPPDRWSTVVAALVETVELVLVRPTTRVRDADVRRLAAHLRSRGGVLVRLPGPGSWPTPPDVTLRVTTSEWQGPVAPSRVDGAGRLHARRVVVEATGRGRSAQPRQAELWLPGATGSATPLDRPIATPLDPPATWSPTWADVG